MKKHFIAFLTHNLLANQASQFFHFRKHGGFLIDSHAGNDMTPFQKTQKPLQSANVLSKAAILSKAKQAVI